MDIHNAEGLGGKSFEALVSTALAIDDRLNDMQSYTDGDFRKTGIHADGNQFAVIAEGLCFNPDAIERFVEIIAQDGVTLTDFETDNLSVGFTIRVDPKEWTPNE